ncbi:hypothetical protein EA472_03310 [Natrarchaeobius oligotrophus]|uniref:3-keto-5-aminohexanoate cleavage protein n=1 Tax=Natrarchaeobius chitinivorans TaxID=1679083 RepID=A0A3N6NR00_NATCH|nr:3-keto-5-aminohexanoate cleavage protein [Natrarchaeobius chitinivorans]RQH02343.1 hypothetical protein EA472_03310 [Natrarchaeobius chitinivorans]
MPLHVRNEESIPDQRPENMTQAIDLIWEEYDPAISINVRGNVHGGSPYGKLLLEESIGALTEEYGGDYVDMETTAPDSDASDPNAPFVMNPSVLREWIEYLQDLDVKPELQGYSYGAMEQANEWAVKPGLLEKPYYINVVTGHHAYFCFGPTSPHPWGSMYLTTYKHSHPLSDEDTFLGAIVGGRNWLPLIVEAILLGYDSVRIGMEDAAMLYPHRDEPIESCRQVVDKIATIARELGREVATPDQARELLDL